MTPIAWQIERFAELESTNTAALEITRERLVRGQPAEGLVVVAARQSRGRGQHGRAWASPAGGLYLSAVLERIAPERRDVLALIAGLATRDAVTSLIGSAPAAQIRWPNDVVIAGRKVAGVLCESIALGDRWAAVVGIGVNVTTDVAALPPEVRVRATAIIAEAPRRDSVTIAAAESAVLAGLTAWSSAPVEAIVAAVRACDALCNRVIRIRMGDREIEGRGAGIGPRGEFLLANNCGTHTVSMGTIVAVDGVTLRP